MKFALPTHEVFFVNNRRISVKHVLKCATFTLNPLLLVCRDLLLFASLTPWWVSFFFCLLSKPLQPTLQKEHQLSNEIKKNLRRRFVSPVWLTGHMSARGSPLRGLLKLVSVSRSPGETEKKGRREHLSRWCALMLARDQIRILFLTLVKTEAWIYAVKIYMQMLICSLPLAGYLEQIVSP